MQERLILLGAILFVAFVVLAWLLMLRSYKRRPSHRHEHSGRRRSHRRTAVGVAELKQMINAKSHRHRREHRSRNPTLAETGGLPPVRNGEPTGSPQPRPQPQ